MFDDSDETCWNSDQGSPQWIEIQSEESDLTEIFSFDIQFQGGFVGKDCYLEVVSPRSDDNLILKQPFYPEDNNKYQHFKLDNSVKGKIFRFVFVNSTDFFGRIVIYKLKLN
ncbi:nuclear receptor 2C2-associated protein isoform X2 [Lycorma delicatula]